MNMFINGDHQMLIEQRMLVPNGGAGGLPERCLQDPILHTQEAIAVLLDLVVERVMLNPCRVPHRLYRGIVVRSQRIALSCLSAAGPQDMARGFAKWARLKAYKRRGSSIRVRSRA